ncbi:MAG TPA: hypothetical protein VHK63_03360 [Candidatus Limnocylindria bacterium]|nr:hypothetical protein [Candidatus Limnocylindria bacterium]
MDWYPWIVLVHVLGAFGFVLGHGVSAHAAFQLRGERDRARVEALLDLSQTSLWLLYGSLLVLLAAGIAAGFVGGWWGRLWIWTSIGILAVIIAAMYAIASPYYMSLRKALGRPGHEPKEGEPAPAPMTADQLAADLRSSRPFWLAAIGGLGLVVIIGLMVLKPF